MAGHLFCAKPLLTYCDWTLAGIQDILSPSSQKLTASDVVNRMDESDLFRILRQYGEERKARLIARAIVDHRYAFGKISNTKELAQIVTFVYERWVTLILFVHGWYFMNPGHLVDVEVTVIKFNSL